MKPITNLHDVSLTLAVWLLHDEYDYNSAAKYISATTLMKPIRQVLLPRRVEAGVREPADVVDYVARALGTSLHDSVEKAWVKGHARSLKMLGYPQSVIDRVMINPTAEELAAAKDPIPIYIEQRATREIMGWTVGGKFDFVAEGMVQDNKSTSAYTWVYGGRNEEHSQQGSIYKWLNPDKIFEDFIRINYIFTDWQKAQVAQNPKYPDQRVKYKDIELMTPAETEVWITRRLQAIEKYADEPEDKLPLCTDDELWLSDPSYKYYADPAKTGGRSTKNSDTLKEAQDYMASKGGKGVIHTIMGVPKRCGYCDGFPICTQKNKYFS
jgi:hypothetical protein